MGNTDLLRAKEMFFRYLGNRYDMARDGVLEEYKRYKVSSKQAMVWREELMELLIDKLAPGGTDAFSDLVEFSQDYPNSEILNRVLRHVSDSLCAGECREDSLGKVIWAEGIARITRALSEKKVVSCEMARRAEELVGMLVDSVLANPIKVDDSWSKRYFLAVDEKHVRERAEQTLIEMKRLLGSDERGSSR